MFKYSCFTENTPEMREWLEMLGYEYQEWSVAGERPETPYLISTQQGQFTDGSKDFLWAYNRLAEEKNLLALIDCRSNPDLFKALTAVREDNYYKQWVICKLMNNKEFWHFCERPSMDDDSRFFGFISYRRPTLAELQEHLKENT